MNLKARLSKDDSDLVNVNHALSGEAANYTYTYTGSGQLQSHGATDARYEWTPPQAGSTVYTPSNLNQYTDVVGTAHSYDLNGNLLSFGATTLSYDSENWLLSFVRTGGGAVTASFAYGPGGRRLEKTVDGLTRKYVYDGDHVIAETDGAGAVLRRFVYQAVEKVRIRAIILRDARFARSSG